MDKNCCMLYILTIYNYYYFFSYKQDGCQQYLKFINYRIFATQFIKVDVRKDTNSKTAF